MDTHFASDFLTARRRFREAATRAGAEVTRLPLTATAPGGERLTIDVAWFGATEPSRALVHSSGIHGVEGFAGSAIQLHWLASGIPPLAPDAAIAIIHVLNPYGMAWLRRANEHNVDLNRNFLGPTERYEGAPAGYAALDGLLNPPGPPAWDLFHFRAAWLIARHGMTSLRQVVAGGQYVNPRGLFYGGSRLEEGPRRLRDLVRQRLASVAHLVAVDVHTGLGPFGEDTLLVHAADEGEPPFERLRHAFGDRVASLDPRSGPAYRVKGAYDSMYPRVLRGAVVDFVAQEFGTYGPVRVVKALRDENRWHHHGGDVAHPTKLDLRETFAPGDPGWRAAVLTRGATVIGDALALLERGPE